MRFANPWMLLCVAGLIPLGLFVFWLAMRTHRKTMDQIGSRALIEELIGSFSMFRRQLKIVIWLLAVALVLFSMARLQFGEKVVEAKRKGIDLIVALDLSESMLAEDVLPNRLEKSKKEIGLLINSLKGDRIGLIGFAGSAFLQCPLTHDQNTAKLLLSVMNTETMAVQGTSISKAIALARRSFNVEERSHKVLIILTDGEDHEGKVLEEAELAVKEGVKIFTVGIGELSGEPIPVRSANGQRVGYKKNKSGEVVVTRLDEAVLRQVANLSGGAYAHVVQGQWGLERIYQLISGMDKKEQESRMVTIYDDKYTPFLAVALFLLLLESLITERRKK